MKELLLVLVGGICSAFGGFFATLYQAKQAGKIKFRETIGERKVAAYGKGLELINGLQTILMKEENEDALKFLYENGSWFVDNLILLPHTFVENWRSIRITLKKVILLRESSDNMPEGAEREKKEDQANTLRSFCDELAQEAEAAIRNELDLPEFKIKHPETKTEEKASKAVEIG
jgi:hypothetical protein